MNLDSPLVPLRSATGVALIAATVLAWMVASIDANVIKAPHDGCALPVLDPVGTS